MSLLKNLLIIALFVSVYVAVSPAFANTDLNKNEYLILTPLLIMILILGFYPALLLDLISSSAEKVSDNMLNYIKIANFIK